MSTRELIRVCASFIVVSVAMTALSGCTSDKEELETWIEQIKARPGGRIDELREIKPYESFAYDATTMRSPFVPAAPAAAANGVRPDSRRNREFLEQFSLDTLNMVGTLKLEGRQFGLVQTKDGLVHRVLPGQYMGQNDGKIVSINDSKISLLEIVPDGMGGYMERPAAIGLSD